MRPLLVVILAAGLVAILQISIKEQMEQRRLEEKLGYLPRKEVLKVMGLDHRGLLGQYIFFKAMTYYGGKIDPFLGSKGIEYYNMYRFIDAATYLDPYNIDAYYFTEAVFTWGIGRIRETNRILQRGLHYRYWDPMLPFFIGFNYFYFLKDYERGARYIQKVAEMQKSSFYTSLASRLLYEANRTDLAIDFLQEMVKEITKENLRRPLLKRLEALKMVKKIEDAMEEFQRRFGRRPHSIEEMVTTGILDQVPQDPYGGRFYIDNSGKVRSTSRFAPARRKQWNR